MRRTLMLIALCAAAGAAQPAAAELRLSVPVSHSTRLNIPGEAKTVVVGDPAVADALVIDRHTIYVQGKGYGQTEIVVLDEGGRTIWQGDVAVVTPSAGSRVSLVRGAGITKDNDPAAQTGGADFTGGGSGIHGAQITEMTCSDVCTPVVASKDAGNAAKKPQ